MDGVSCIAILGPTCSWKSAVGLALAEELHGEVVSCDSMQIYRGLPIGTAQPDDDALSRAPHHLIAELSIHEPYDANRFVQRAKAALEDVSSRGKQSILVGGTGLYARSLIYGFQLLPADTAVFQSLEEELSLPDGKQRLLNRLKAASGGDCIPPDVALNPRRLVRACEVLALTGEPPWRLRTEAPVPDPAFREFCLIPKLEMLKGRIRRRTRKMLDDGWIDEARAADEDGLMETPTARQALGYREIIEYLHHGMAGGVDALAELLSNRTIQYARRQLTWFKHQHPHAVMVDIDEEEGAVERILAQVTPTGK